MSEKRKAYIAAISYAFIIGLSFMFVKVTLTVASPTDILAHRFTFAFIGIVILMVFTKNKLTIKKYDLLKILPLAILYPIVFFTFQVLGLAKISSSEAGIIQATIPIFTLALAGLLLKEKATRGQLVFISLSVLGVIYMLIMNGANATTGNVIGSGLILLSALAASLYNVFARRLTKQYSLLILTYVMTLCGFVIFNGVALGNHLMNGTIDEFFQPLTHVDFVIAILYLGLLSSLGTSYLSNYALSKLEASKMSVFSNFATLITILAGVLFLQEVFHLYHFIGGIIIIIGVIGTNYFGQRQVV
ncbi:MULTISPECIES: DMT family transporter [Lysinibacillus]|jgi:drug/metabolite transporter (DMT)-like permease|uniref:EamA family transporter n=1 Tax=Lysinibacillus fusiformis TaxID=28031 RepID=A0A2I0UWN6_9BACI|nr:MULTISPECIES: DMT family transporter [Lysinibacillus]KUF35175.1 transporter [Lysinibacillus sp. F5]MEE3808049.1 DMT family transporter [Lysinibacillus fusiformis]PKU50481.1 EamA family transporter [Lysinibacillus fusiformis]SCY84593.1 EamA-like transporter family protein [Lysinibacillus sp. SG9]SDB36814.1 EamA-like transporter family protein [Lysinibacillus sp. TC-37]